MVLRFLSKALRSEGRTNPEILGTVELCVAGLLSGQSAEGGWGFAPSHCPLRFGDAAPSELKAALADASSPDLTARVVLGLMSARQSGSLDVTMVDRLDDAVDRTVAYFRSSQGSDGSWWGRWVESSVLSTASVLLATRAADVDPKDDWIQRARQWLLERGLAATSLAERASALAAVAVSSADEDGARTSWLLERLLALLDDLERPSPGARYPILYGVDRFEAPLFDSMTVAFSLLLLEASLRKGTTRAREEILWGRQRSSIATRRKASTVDLAKAHAELIRVGTALAGEPDSIGDRIAVHYSVYRDAIRNFTFPLLALHGAGWAHGYFGLLDAVLPLYATLRFPLSWRKRDEFKRQMIRAMTGFKVANQRVLRDTFANYHFSRWYGMTPGADVILPRALLGMYNELHRLAGAAQPLTERRKRDLYEAAFQWEQKNSVWPMVERTIRDIRDPFVRAIAFRPIVHFAYFPRFRFLFFSDFTNTEERITEGRKAYGIAEEVGWAVTERAIGKYAFVALDALEHHRHALMRIHVPQELSWLSGPNAPS